MRELADAGVGELLELYATGEASPVEAVEACLQRIQLLNPAVNAVLTVNSGPARRAAEESSRRWLQGLARPLEGIPFGLKDVIATAGLATTGGSGIYRSHVPTRDATVAHLLAAAGGVMLAKLQTFSFALGGPGNRDYGPTRNPWDLERTSGGSSSGPAAALAARMLPLAIGTDTGGSIRIPAAFCGVAGLRPTYGRVSTEGVMMLSWTLDTVGPMARTAADCALVLPVISQRAGEANREALPADLRGVRVGVCEEFFFDVCDPEVAAAIHASVDVMTELGAVPVEIQLPHVHLADAIGRTIVTVEAASLHESTLDRIAEYDDALAERLLAAQFVGALDYARSLRLQRLLGDDFAAAFARVDVVATPTTAVAAPLLDGETVELGDETVAWRQLATRATFPASLAGLPVVSTHAGFTSRQLPVGMQIAAPPFQDELCLRVASAYEAASGHGAPAPPPFNC